MFDFYGKRRIFFSISLGLFLLGIIVAFMFGVKLDVTFKGGSIIAYSYTGDIDIDAVQTTITEVTKLNCSVQQTEDFATKTKRMSVTLEAGESGSVNGQAKLTEALNTAYPNHTFAIESSSNVPSTMGQSFFLKSLAAIALASVLMVLYVAFRFKKIGGWSAGAMGLIALVHDCLMVLVTFIVFRMPLDTNFVAVVLTILGFSLNDTIVIYDRVRENRGIYGIKMPVEQLTNLSISQSLTRSVYTTVATLLATVIMTIFSYIFNLESIRTFSLPMTIGLISGSYSTIFIALPLWVVWQKHSIARREALAAAPTKKPTAKVKAKAK